MNKVDRVDDGIVGQGTELEVLAGVGPTIWGKGGRLHCESLFGLEGNGAGHDSIIALEGALGLLKRVVRGVRSRGDAGAGWGGGVDGRESFCCSRRKRAGGYGGF